MQSSLFSISLLDGETFEAYTDGEDWNGWARPYFTFDSARQLVAAWIGQGWKAAYNEDEDTFSFEEATDGEVEKFPPVVVDGRKLYPIGAGSWIWEDNRMPES